MDQNITALNKSLTLVECPRDAMQGWLHFIPTEQKISYINALLKVGFHTLDFGSFVSPKSIPQMADTHRVMEGIDQKNSNTKLLAIVANERGVEEALLYENIDYLGFPFSISPTFQMRNAHSTLEESVQRVEAIQELCLKNNRQLVVYLSMGFGNPYGDAYNEEILLHWAAEMANKEIGIISLADTVGMATPEQITEALEILIPAHPAISFGVHLHAAHDSWQPKMDAAFNAGCLRFDGAINGIGGCPMAQDELVGNMDTTNMIPYFAAKNSLPSINLSQFNECVQIANQLFV